MVASEVRGQCTPRERTDAGTEADRAPFITVHAAPRPFPLSLDPVGEIVGTPPADDREPEPLRLYRGAEVLELLAIVAGFLLLSGCVMAVARSSTARWERERRAARVPRRRAVPPPTPASGRGARLREAVASTAAAGRRAAAAGRAPLEAVGRILRRPPRHSPRRPGTAPRTRGARRFGGLRRRTPDAWQPGTRGQDPPVDGTESCDAAPGVLEPTREARPATGELREGGTDLGARRAIPRLTRRLATRLVHRHGRNDGPSSGTGSDAGHPAGSAIEVPPPPTRPG